jgi:O-antigen chain-terminating methyltransferase
MVFDYPEFEAYFRGSREEVLRKQESYLPFIQQLAIDHEHPVLDIACGRGEWLELLRENGIPAEGVELNHEFATHCKGNGLIVENADLFDFFSRAEGKTYKLITGFHIIEHLSLEQQQEFLEKALERLAPGGAMLLETPNPENTSVGCCDFYLDPTHVRPLPPLLLQFLVHQAGFSSPFIVRLNRFIVGTPLRLMPESFQYADIFNQLVRLISTQLQQAPDYALIGFKGHAPTDSALKILNQIILESENYSPKETSSDNQVNLLQQNEFFALMKEQTEKITKALAKIRRLEKLLIYTEDNLRNATSTMQCKDQQLRHGEEEYHTALMLYEYDEQIITAHAKIQQLESILLDTKKELHDAKSTLQCKDEQLRHREEEYHTALTQLRERERELKSVYRTAAGQFILYYKSVKNKWKKNNASSEQFEVPHNTDQEVVHDEPSRSKSVQYVYMQLLNARQRNRMKHHNS